MCVWGGVEWRRQSKHVQVEGVVPTVGDGVRTQLLDVALGDGRGEVGHHRVVVRLQEANKVLSDLVLAGPHVCTCARNADDKRSNSNDDDDDDDERRKDEDDEQVRKPRLDSLPLSLSPSLSLARTRAAALFFFRRD